jgi:hypothetical protein
LTIPVVHMEKQAWPIRANYSVTVIPES